MDTIAHIPPEVDEGVRTSIELARRALDTALGLLLERPALTAPPEHVEHALGAARIAADHLYDVGQFDGRHEAVREALAAADVIAGIVAAAHGPHPNAGDGRAEAAERLFDVDCTLATLERRLHLT